VRPSVQTPITPKERRERRNLKEMGEGIFLCGREYSQCFKCITQCDCVKRYNYKTDDSNHTMISMWKRCMVKQNKQKSIEI
jgi:hypothetical protein